MAALAALALAITAAATPPPQGEIHVHFINVGQGDAILHTGHRQHRTNRCRRAQDAGHRHQLPTPGRSRRHRLRHSDPPPRRPHRRRFWTLYGPLSWLSRAVRGTTSPDVLERLREPSRKITVYRTDEAGSVVFFDHGWPKSA